MNFKHSLLFVEFESRCPLGKKTKYYKRAKLEKFAPYLMKDGLVSKLSVYNDYELKDLKLVCYYVLYSYMCALMSSLYVLMSM